MFDIGSYGSWLIVVLVGLIIFRPDDWEELAFHGGRWIRRIRAYVFEWQEYLEFSPEIEKARLPEKTDNSSQSALCLINPIFLSPSVVCGRIISIQPHV